jgi:hypothetical protein
MEALPMSLFDKGVARDTRKKASGLRPDAFMLLAGKHPAYGQLPSLW